MVDHQHRDDAGHKGDHGCQYIASRCRREKESAVGRGGGHPGRLCPGERTDAQHQQETQHGGADGIESRRGLRLSFPQPVAPEENLPQGGSLIIFQVASPAFSLFLFFAFTY